MKEKIKIEAINQESVSEQEKKKCFIITPISANESTIRKKAEGLIDSIIRPVLENNAIEIIVPHQMANPGSITNQVIIAIMESELVICNLTGLNPNVMYELAVRHAVKLPIVLMAEEGTILPFDINNERVIFYKDELHEVELLKQRLDAFIKASIGKASKDNPIYRALESFELHKILMGEPTELVLTKIEEILSILRKNQNLNHSTSGIEFSKVNIVFGLEDLHNAINAANDFVKANGSSINRLETKLIKNNKAVISYYFLTTEGDLGSKFHWYMDRYVKELRMNPSTEIYDIYLNQIL